MNQLTIDFTLHPAAIACNAKAEAEEPGFTEKAKAVILKHLAIVGQCPGEDLTDLAIAHGCRPKDARAFGAVFNSLSRKNLIRTVGFCARKKGHNTAGGRIWGIVL